MKDPVKICYRNHRGEVGLRLITPIEIWFGRTQWHEGNQWLLKAHDHNKDAVRDFALQDVYGWFKQKESK